MTAWPGVRSDVSEVGDGLSASQNTRYRYRSELRQRVGLTRSTIPQFSGATQRMFATKTDLWLLHDDRLSWVPLADIKAGTPVIDNRYIDPLPIPANHVTIGDVAYHFSVNGSRAVGGTSPGPIAATIGLAAPGDYGFIFNIGGDGEVGLGKHLVRARYKTLRGPFDVWSNPGEISTCTAIEEDDAIQGGGTVFPIEWQTRYLELTTGDGATFYQTIEADWDGDNFTKPDVELQQYNPSSLIGDYGHEAPYDSQFGAWIRGRMFVSGANENSNRVFWSRSGFPESFYKTQFFFDALENGDTVVALQEYIGDLWVFGRASADRYVWASDPIDGERVVLPGTLGVWNQRCIVRADRDLYGWGPNGVWVIQGGRQMHISRPIDDIIADSQDTSNTDRFHAVYNPEERIIQFFYVSDDEYGDGLPHHAAVLDIDENVWYTHKWDHAITASITVMTSDVPRTILADGNGRTWIQGGAADGQDSPGSSLQTVLAGSTTTVVNLEDAAPCEGSYLYYPTTGELRLIRSYAGVSATLDSALSSAPLSGEEVSVGGIGFRVETKWWNDQSLAVKKQPSGLYIEYVPQNEGSFRIEVYRDFSDTLVTFDPLLATDTLPDGVTLGHDGVLNVGIDGSGFAKVPLEINTARALKAVVISDRLAPSPQLLRVAFMPEPHGNRRGDLE